MFWLKFHWNVFLKVQIITNQHLFRQSFFILIITIYHFISHRTFPPGSACNLKCHKLSEQDKQPLAYLVQGSHLNYWVFQFDSLTLCNWSLIHPDWSQTATKRLIFPELATGVITVQSSMSTCWPSQELILWHDKNWEVCKNPAITCRPFHPTYGSSSINFWQSGTWKNIYPSHEINVLRLMQQVIQMKQKYIFLSFQ